MKNTFKFKLTLSLFLVMMLFSTSIYAISLPNKVLPFMSKGSDVVNVQKSLNTLGSNVVPDGIYGNGTKKAVMEFQKKHSSLSADGIYGPSTKTALEKALGNDGAELLKPELVVPNKVPAPKPETTEKVAYLTFDDGPSTKVTPRILKTLDDYGIKATFFLLGSMAESNPELVKTINSKGHSIGNHSYSHKYGYIYQNSTNFLAELNLTDKAFKNILGKDFSTQLFRFPSGSYGENKNPYKKLVQEKGYKYYDWNVLNGDAEGLNIPASKLVSRVKETTKGQKSIVVLMHDSGSKTATADSLAEVIDYLIGQGYSFDKLPQ